MPQLYCESEEPNVPLFLIRTSLLQLAPLEAVLFDVDGTLCDTDPLHYDAFREMLQEVGIFLNPTVSFPWDAMCVISFVSLVCHFSLWSSSLTLPIDKSLQQIGFNGGVPIDEEYFIANIAGKHNEDIASILFPDNHERGVKFLEDKEAMFRRFLPIPCFIHTI